MKKYANTAELAAELHLSRSTVSYILNGRWKERNISPKTVQRVLDYAEKVHFVPNLFGRAIKGKEKMDAAILLPENLYNHHQQAFFQLLPRLSSSGLRYMILPVPYCFEATPLLEQLTAYGVSRALLVAAPILRSFNLNACETLVSASPQIDWLFYDCLEKTFLGRLPEFENFYSIGFNRSDARTLIAEYAVMCGYSELLCFGFPLNTPESFPIRLTPLAVSDDLRGGHPEFGLKIADCLLRLPSGSPRAVFINDDLLTIGAIQHLLDLGRMVPEEFAFLSWDGLAVSRFFRRSLTTLEVPHEQMTEFASRFLLDGEKFRTILPARIRPGESMRPLQR